MTFNQWLLEARAKKGYTLDEVSIRSGVSKSYLHDIENKGAKPSIEKASLITRGAFGLELWKVLKLAGI